MEHRLSPRESRRLVRQFLRQEQRLPAVVLHAAGAVPREESVPFAQPARHMGPYEVEDITSAGYLVERTIIVP